MFGTILNAIAVFVGGLAGLGLGNRLPERVRGTILNGLGLFVIAAGLQMTLESTNNLITLGAIMLGGLLGEWGQIEDRLHALGTWLEARFARSGSTDGAARFIRGFVTASLLFCVGPMTILGSIQDGLTGDFQLLAIKSVLDGFAALAFAAASGVGVLFSIVVILGYQGGLSLLAAQANQLLTPEMITELTAAGGVLVMATGIGPLLELRKIRVGNYLPALIVAPLIVAALPWLAALGRLLGLEV